MKKVFSIIGICFGIMIMIHGVLSSTGHYSRSTVDDNIRFGADFYTEEYEATATVANNTYSVVNALESLKGSFGQINIGFGGAITCYFFCVYADTKKTIPAVAQVVNKTANVTKEDELPDL